MSEVVTAEALASFEFGDGFHEPEFAHGLPFRWMSRVGSIRVSPVDRMRYFEASVHSNFYDLSQHLSTGVPGAAPERRVLARGWNPVSVEVPAGTDSVRFEASKIFPREYYPTDTRELAVQFRHGALHEDAARHAHLRRQQANTALNLREQIDGRTRLASTPQKLGIDIQGACNIKPPCVYCQWDTSKELEGDNVDVPFNTDTLRAYGDLFENAAELVNCSIGEPFMGKDLDALLDAFGRRGKVLEAATNGQILTDSNIRRLLGRDVHLYCSLDAATAETYAKLRNNRFDLVLANVRRLIQAKGGRHKLPLVYLVFMPMRANVHEAEKFVELCADLGVDRMVLRPLNPTEGVTLTWDRAGYRYEYQKELLPWEELVRVSGRVAETARRLGVELSDQMDFGGSMEEQFAEYFAAGRREAAARFDTEPVSAFTPTTAAPDPPPPAPPAADTVPPPLGHDRLPACTEPWSSLYILRRGVLPCCYGSKPIAPMDGFEEAWNSPVMQDIRRDLARGTFHTYCLDSPDCPIVNKSQRAHVLSLREAATLRGRRWHLRWKREGYGWPGRAYRKAKRMARAAIRPFAGGDPPAPAPKA